MEHTKEEGQRLIAESISRLQNQSQIIEFSDEAIPSLLQPGYMAPAKNSNQHGTT